MWLLDLCAKRTSEAEVEETADVAFQGYKAILVSEGGALLLPAVSLASGTALFLFLLL